MAEQFVVVSSGNTVVESAGNAIVLGGADVLIESRGRSGIQNSITTVQRGYYSIAPAFSLTGRGSSSVYRASTSAQRGASTILIEEDGLLHVVVGYGKNVVASAGNPVILGLTSVGTQCRGKSVTGLANLTSRTRGLSCVFGGVGRSTRGISKIGFTAVLNSDRGRSRIYGPFESKKYGKSGILNNTAAGRRGQSKVYAAYYPKDRGYSRVLGSMSTPKQGKSRIANDSVAGWVVYVGSNSMPNFNGSYSGFSTSLPVSVPITPPVSGTKKLFVVVRKRNKYGLISQNSHPEIITINSSGSEVMVSLTAPENLGVHVTPDGKLKIGAAYPQVYQDKNPATAWRFWVGSSAPNVSNSPDVSVSVNGPGMIVTLGPYSPGTYHIAVALYRSGDVSQSPESRTTVVIPDAPNSPSFVPHGYQV